MKKRKLISAAIILSGLAAFLVIVNLPDKDARKTAPANGPGQNMGSTGLQFQTNPERNLFANPISGNQTSKDTNNLTDQLAQTLSQNILEMNNGFSQGTSTIALPSSESLGNAVGQAAAGQNLQFRVFTEKDIRVDSDNSPVAQLTYMGSLKDIANKNFGNFKTPIADILNNFFEKNDPSALAKYVDIAGKEVADLLALKVPQQLSVWHLQNINLWGKKLVVYKAILDLNNDPLKAAMAIQQVNGIGQENDNLQNVLNGYIKKLTTG